MYDAREVTNWFIERAAVAGEPLTIMALLKLAYIAHGWHLALRGEPLFPNKIEAWTFGPVAPDIYNAFRPKGATLDRPAPDYPTVADEKGIDFLRQIYDIYGQMSAWKLSSLTHVKDGPWDTTIKLGGYYAEIPNELIRAHYIIKWNQSEKERQSAAS